MVSLATVIAFWRRKDPQLSPEQQRIIPLPQLSSSDPGTNPATTKEQVDGARERLKVLKLERQIIGSAVATIYESHSKGVISTLERDRLLQKYKVDLSELEQSINENQRIVDLYDLETSRNELVKEFNAKLAEMDTRIKGLRSGSHSSRESSDPQNAKAANPGKGTSAQDGDDQKAGNRKTKNEQDQQINDAEKRIEQIREEILKAMDRLEQIEAEG